MKKMLAVVCILVLTILPVGCSSSDLTAAIQDIEQKLPQIAEMASGLLNLVAPEYAPLVAPIAAAIKADGDTLVDLVKQYKASPNATLAQKINSAVQVAVSHLGQLATGFGIKDPKTLGILQSSAGLLGFIFNDIASWIDQAAPKAVAMQFPAAFGWHLPGVDLIAVDGKKLPTPVPGGTKHSGYSAGDLAKQWNTLCKNHDKAKIHQRRKHLWILPLPFTGHR